MKLPLKVLLILSLTSCGPRLAPPPNPFAGYGMGPSEAVSAKAGESGLRSQKVFLEGELKKVKGEIREARIAPLRGLFRWGAWIGGGAILVAIVVAVLLKSRWPLLGAAAGAALLVSCLVMQSLLDYIVPIGIGLVVVTLLAGLLYEAHKHKFKVVMR